MKAITTDFEERQLEALALITTERVPRAEHIRRAVDMYLSQPAIQEALAEAEKRAGDNTSGV